MALQALDINSAMWYTLGLSQVNGMQPITNMSSFFGIPHSTYIQLYWTYPQDNSVASVKIMRKDTDYPQTDSDGTFVYSGNGITCNDTNVVTGTTYYYRLFTYNSSGALINTFTMCKVKAGIVYMKFRYIRDWVNGSDLDGNNNHWIEVKAFDQNGTNVALNKSCTTNGTLSSSSFPLSNAVDGVVSLASRTAVDGISGGAYLKIDLGQVYDIKTITVWHVYQDGRKYHNTRTELSEDGVNWYSVFDSSISGEYKETANGHTINVNVVT